MSREAHVQFWEGVGVRFPALLDYQRAYDSVGEARTSIGRYLDFYNRRHPHEGLAGSTPDKVFIKSLPPIPAAA